MNPAMIALLFIQVVAQSSVVLAWLFLAYHVAKSIRIAAEAYGEFLHHKKSR